MLNDMEMLNAIYKNARMGCQGIEEIVEYANKPDFLKALETQQKEYESICKEAEKMMLEKNEKPEDITPMAKMSSKTMTMVKTMQDNSQEHLAEMMYQGSAMGVTKIIRKQREYTGSNLKICELAKRLLKTEENNMEQMRKFM